jgi:hypothetical protein
VSIIVEVICHWGGIVELKYDWHYPNKLEKRFGAKARKVDI